MSRISIVNPGNPAAPGWNVRCQTLGKYGGFVAELKIIPLIPKQRWDLSMYMDLPLCEEV
jgi:hypothetical protein